MSEEKPNQVEQWKIPKEPTEKILSIGNYTAENGRNHYQSTGIIPETGKKVGNDRHFDTKGEVYPLAVNEKSVFLCFPSPHPTPFVYQQITSRKDNKEPGTSSLSAGQRFPYPA